MKISNTGIKSLRDYFAVHPEHAGVTHLDCGTNKLTNLIGCPAGVIKLDCDGNQLTNLVGCPASVTDLFWRNNPVDHIYRDIDCNNPIKREAANQLMREKCIAESYLLFLRHRFFHQSVLKI